MNNPLHLCTLMLVASIVIGFNSSAVMASTPPSIASRHETLRSPIPALKNGQLKMNFKLTDTLSGTQQQLAILLKHQNNIALCVPAPTMDVNETLPIAETLTNPCNDDQVELAGTSHIIVHSTEANNGNTHYYLDVTNSLSGVGAPSLESYQGSTRDLYDFISNAPYPIVQTIYSSMLLHAQGNTDDFYFRYHYKVTINSNGTVAVEFLDSTEDCKG